MCCATDPVLVQDQVYTAQIHTLGVSTHLCLGRVPPHRRSQGRGLMTAANGARSVTGSAQCVGSIRKLPAPLRRSWMSCARWEYVKPLARSVSKARMPEPAARVAAASEISAGVESKGGSPSRGVVTETAGARSMFGDGGVGDCSDTVVLTALGKVCNPYGRQPSNKGKSLCDRFYVGSYVSVLCCP